MTKSFSALTLCGLKSGRVAEKSAVVAIFTDLYKTVIPLPALPPYPAPPTTPNCAGALRRQHARNSTKS